MNSHKNKKVKIFGVPLDLGTKKLGVDIAPNALRYAGLTNALKFNKILFEDFGNLTINNTLNNNQTTLNLRKEIALIADQLAHLTYQTLLNNQIPIILGGDHSVSIGSIAGASKKAKRLGLLWLDCHPDANVPSNSPSGNIHGMTVAISLGHGHPELVNCAGFSPKVFPDSLCIIGAKDIDAGEEEFLKHLGVKMFTLFDIQEKGIVDVMECALELLTKKCDLV